MTTKGNTLEGGTNTTTITVGNSGGASGDAFEYVPINGGSGLTYSSTPTPAHGSLCMKFQPAASVTVAAQYGVSGTYFASTSAAVRFYLYMTALPTAAIQIVGLLSSAPVRLTSLHFDATGKLYFRDSTASTLWTATSTFPLNQWVRVEMWSSIATSSTGQIHCKYYLGDSLTQVDGGDVTNANNGSATTYDSWTFGKLTSDAYSTAYYVDDPKVSFPASGYIGPVAGNVAPSVNPGSTQYVPAGTVNLSMTATDSDGTISTFGITRTSGPDSPTVTVANSGIGTASAGATSTVAVIPGTYVFTGSATDNAGGNTTQPVTINVYPAPATDAKVVAVGSSNYTLVGSAGSLVAALNDVDDTTYAQSPIGPVGEVIPITLAPLGPGPITIWLKGLQSPSSPLITVQPRVYKADGTTLIYTPSSFLDTGTAAETAIVLDSAALAAIPNTSDRAALVLKVTLTTA